MLKRFTLLFASFGLGAFLVGCGGGSPGAFSVTQPPANPASMRLGPTLAAKDVYVTQESGSGAARLFEFGPQNRSDSKPICTRQAPNGVVDIAADPAGDLYLPDIAQSKVKVFAPACGPLVGTIHDPYGGPIGVIIQGATIYLADGVGVGVCSMHGCTSHLSSPAITQLSSAAVDLRGDVWGAGYGASGITLVVWQGAKMPGHVVSGYIESGTPGDIMFDNADDLVTVDTFFSKAYRFECQLAYFSCTQLVSIDLHGRSNFGALNGTNSDIQVSDLQFDSVDVYSYPNFAYEYSYDASFNNTAVEGIAQVP